MGLNVRPVFPPHDPQYGAPDTYRIAADWLDGHGAVWDWGCGSEFAKRFFGSSAYHGIDGMRNGVDLATVEVQCDCILMRHILENNPDDWRAILDNAVRSFRNRMALVTFMPFAETTHVAKVEQYDSGPVSYLRFAKRDLTEAMKPYLVADFPVETTHHEHVFFLERK